LDEDGSPGVDRLPTVLIARAGGWGYSDLLRHLDRLTAMLKPGAALEENLLGLPLERELTARRTEHQRAEEAKARQTAAAAAEAARAAQQAAVWRKKTMSAEAALSLGDEEGGRWLATPLRSLGNVAVTTLDGLTEEQYSTIYRELAAEKARRVREADRQATISALQETLRTEARAYGYPEWVDFWMRSQNQQLGGRRPVEVCTDRAGLDRCRMALRHEPRRLMRA
jgi:hypothetical protein